MVSVSTRVIKGRPAAVARRRQPDRSASVQRLSASGADRGDSHAGRMRSVRGLLAFFRRSQPAPETVMALLMASFCAARGRWLCGKGPRVGKTSGFRRQGAMAPAVLFEIVGLAEGLPAARVRADKGLVSCMDPVVPVKIVDICEGLPAVLVEADKGLVSGMGSLVHLQA